MAVELVALVTVAVALLLPLRSYYWDQESWIHWTQVIQERGVGGSYLDAGVVNYPPLWLSVLWAYGKLLPTTSAQWEAVAWLKLVPLLFDALSCIAILWVLRRAGRSPFWVLPLLLNPALYANTVAWGQVDSIHRTLGVLGLLAAVTGAPAVAGGALALALTMKLQAVVFLPVAGLVLLRDAVVRGWRVLVRASSAVLSTAAVVLAPVAAAGALSALWRVVTQSTSTFPVVVVGADNVWMLVYGSVARTMPDLTEVGGVTLRTIGLALLAANVALLCALTVRVLWSRQPIGATERLAAVSLATGLCVVAFYLFPTQMHSRYVAPAVVFLAIHAVLTRSWVSYALVSLASVLNIEEVLRHDPVILRSLSLAPLRYGAATIVDPRAAPPALPFVLEPRFVALLVVAGYVVGVTQLWRAGRQPLTPATAGGRSGRTSPPARSGRRSGA